MLFYLEMNNFGRQILLLERIQRIDIEISEMEVKSLSLPMEIRELERNIESVKEDIRKTQKEIEGFQSLQRRLQREVEVERERIERDEERLKQVGSEKEYKALLKEIEVARKVIEKKEEEILTIMEDIENREFSLKEKEERFKVMLRELDGRRNVFLEKKEALKKGLEDKKKERYDVAKAILPELLKQYEVLKRQKHGTAVVPVRDGICLGCYMSLPPQVYIQTQRQDSIVFCPHCQCILFVESGKG